MYRKKHQDESLAHFAEFPYYKLAPQLFADFKSSQAQNLASDPQIRDADSPLYKSEIFKNYEKRQRIAVVKQPEKAALESPIGEALAANSKESEGLLFVGKGSGEESQDPRELQKQSSSGNVNKDADANDAENSVSVDQNRSSRQEVPQVIMEEEVEDESDAANKFAIRPKHQFKIELMPSAAS